MPLAHFLLAFSVLAPACTIGHIAAQQPGAPPPTSSPASKDVRDRELRLTFLGNAGWEITDGHTVILVDPYLSANMLDSLSKALNLTAEMTRDIPIPAPDSVTINAHVRRADFILITHGHVDHAFDAPYIARKRGAVIIGSETVVNIARAYNVPDSSLITVVGGEDFEFGAFSLKVIPNLHTASSASGNKRFYNGDNAGTTPRGLKGPLTGRAFQEGGNKAYLLRMAGHEVLIMGSMNFIEREMNGLTPDVALVGARNSRRQIYNYTGRLMRALGFPPLVLPTHCCYFPGDPEPISFKAEVKEASPGTRVIIPALYESIIVPPRAVRR